MPRFRVLGFRVALELRGERREIIFVFPTKLQCTKVEVPTNK